ncbi:MAG: MarR family transcriptional regulator [Candidatus Buchananbacteria bacterium]|nr:MarR family transcriptional regulator [Candidatus Buchananbacteria bacterium]
MNQSKREKHIEDIVAGFKGLYQQLHASFLIEPNSCPITQSQWLVLTFIAKHSKPTIRDLRTVLGISSSAVTQLVNILEKKGYVVRRIHPDDGRASMLELSSRARKTFNALKNRRLKEIAKLFDIFTDDELLKYVALHRKLTGQNY